MNGIPKEGADRAAGVLSSGILRLLTVAFLSCLWPAMPIESPIVSLVDVDVPRIREGIAFRGASVPFGMAMFGPNGGDTASGYSLTTLQGAEVSDQMVAYLPFLPTTLPVSEAHAAGPVRNRNVGGAPGSFADTLPDGIEVELTASKRVGFARFTFPVGVPQTVRYQATSATATGSLVTGSQDKGSGSKVFFAAEFDRPFDSRAPGAVGFPTGERRLLMKVGISYVSTANAKQNLHREIPGWDFDKVRRQARRAWNEVLSRVEVQGGTAKDRSLLATCLYRTHLQPNLFSDVSGEYLGFDHQVHRAGLTPQYASYSTWDTYRSWVQLIAVLQPKQASDMMQTLVRSAEQGGGAMPRWAAANRETGIMEEGSATPLVASAFAFGARGFDTESAFRAMHLVESQPGARCQTTEAHPSLDLFLKHGFMPQGEDYNRKRSASFTLEYGMAAFALSSFAGNLGKTSQAAHYLEQSQAWKHLFNSANGHIQARNADGSWFPSEFEPAKGHFIGFTEGNSAQYTWTVRHNLRAVIEKMGGRATAISRLDEFFRELNAGPASPHCWIGNEPSLTIPWVYHWCGAPAKTQRVVDRILDEVWQAGSIPGADDLGTLSAWYVWASVGLMPAIPGTEILLLTAPRFDRVIIQLAGGKRLTIETVNGGHPDARFIRSVLLNGQALSANWLRWSDLAAGGTLSLTLSPTQDMLWGVRPADEPPSYDSAPNASRT